MAQIFVSPSKRLFIESSELEALDDLMAYFAKGSGHGLLALDTWADRVAVENETFAYWKDFARLYLSLFSSLPNLEQIDLKKNPPSIEFPKDDLNQFLAVAPMTKGSEYLDKECLQFLWQELELALVEEIIDSGKNISEYFSSTHSTLNLLGRVCFHLAENKKSPDTPFAFLATYANKISSDGQTQHLPLGRALEQYSGSSQKSTLLRLLSPIHKASTESQFLRPIVDSGDIFHPLAWSASETHQFLKDIPLFEKSGIAVKVPNWWKPKQPNRPQVSIKIGDKEPSSVGFEALLDFSMSVTIGGEDLKEKEIQELLQKTENLVFFKGQWVEVDKEKLSDLLGKWKSISKQVKNEGVSFAEGMRWLSGMSTTSENLSGYHDNMDGFNRVVSGTWLSDMLEKIRSPNVDDRLNKILSKELKATLRPYQQQGVAWLNTVHQLRLGAILADDMGLGKSIQVISLLLLKKQDKELRNKSCLLVVPASLIGNWKSEIEKFSPSLKVWIAHPSGDGNKAPNEFNDYDLYITTYGAAYRIPWLSEQTWGLIILDEAQAIKNPDAKQARSIKLLNSCHRIALTGTPVENHLFDLWSLFDFVSPGLLGSAKEFEKLLKQKPVNGTSSFASIRSLVKPYILRRLKTDKSVISDLPDKTELKAYCSLSKSQVVLYQKSVETMTKEIEAAEGIKRRGIILSYLMRFKQICNHPSHFVKDGVFNPIDSGKYLRLKEICEVIADKQEKVLIFTQFKEMTNPIFDYLQILFGRPGLILHGEIPIKKRMEMVNKFQEIDGPPYFVLSLKAGGTGLNLTQASHVIHFDRWWNPAIENQATDRAFRIGQKKNVLVHKFICKGTLEEKVDAMIESKQIMSKEILDGEGGALLTEMSNEDLIKIVSLDINSVQNEIG
ncbi:MAG: DEAD/DEAH box helicase [Bacteriovoracaceae bacterium]|nr:DEAD/DEAH box helicase [Bacteriovoracaceae bacterium]